MSHNIYIYIYIFVMAGVTYLIRMLPLVLAKNFKSVYQIVSLLCAVCLPGSHDISGNSVCDGKSCFRGSRAGRCSCSSL